MSLTNPNKPVTEARLQEFYHRIKNFLGFTEMPSEDISKVVSPMPSVMSRLPVLFDESGTEQVVGWYKYANGTKQPVYEKTFSLTFPVVTTDGTYVADTIIIDDLNVEQVVSQDGYWVENGWSWVPLNFVSDNGQFHTSVYVWKDTTTNHMKLKYGTDRIRYGNQPFVAKLRYTKTTDTPQ